MSILEQLAHDLAEYLVRAVYARCVECDTPLDPDSDSSYCPPCTQVITAYMAELDDIYETCWGEL